MLGAIVIMIEIRHRDMGSVLASVDGDTLSGADLAGRDLDGAYLAGQVLSGTNLDRCRLRRADLRHATVDIVRSLNEFIFNFFGEAHLLLSFIAAQIDLDHRTITFSGAGHPAAMHLRPGTDRMHALYSQNTVLGVKEDCLAAAPEHTLTLAAGDRLLFYTDGLTETTNAQGRRLGQSRLGQMAVDALSTDTFNMADHVLEDVARYRHGPPTDDVTLIIVEMK